MAKLDKLEQQVLDCFWDWVKKHDAKVQWIQDHLWMCIESEDIPSLSHTFEIEGEYGLSCFVTEFNKVWFEVNEILGCFNFGMQQVYDYGRKKENRGKQ